ncbi:MAG TPA: hypothetical protein VKA03_01070 [Methylovirgula sp.]|nr:hypothetical protein [Methylovirgula sp.]
MSRVRPDGKHEAAIIYLDRNSVIIAADAFGTFPDSFHRGRKKGRKHALLVIACFNHSARHGCGAGPGRESN